MHRPLALLVEDEPLLRSETWSLLMHAGMRVHLVRQARALGELVDRGDNGGVCLVVMSVEFCGSTGGDWLAEMSRREAWNWMPTIATTLAPSSVFACALRRSKVPVLAKPVEAGPLAVALDELGLALSPVTGELARAASLTRAAVEQCRRSRALRAASVRLKAARREPRFSV